MKDLLVLAVHLITTIAKLMGPGGARAIVAESLLMKQQLLVVNRSRQRAPNLSALDRFLFGFWSLFLVTSLVSIYSQNIAIIEITGTDANRAPINELRFAISAIAIIKTVVITIFIK